MKTKLISSYLILGLILICLSLIYILYPGFRLLAAVLIGLSYFIWGLLIHRQEHTLHLPIVLEYFSLSLLTVIILIFLSLRA